MDCRKVVEALARHDPAGRPEGAVERHLARCSDCRSTYEELRAVDATVREALVFEHPPDFWEDFYRGLKSRLKAREI